MIALNRRIFYSTLSVALSLFISLFLSRTHAPARPPPRAEEGRPEGRVQSTVCLNETKTHSRGTRRTTSQQAYLSTSMFVPGVMPPRVPPLGLSKFWDTPSATFTVVCGGGQSLRQGVSLSHSLCTRVPKDARVPGPVCQSASTFCFSLSFSLSLSLSLFLSIFLLDDLL